MTPRGIANCNPGNIRRTQTLWQGEAGQQPDPSFLVFAAPQWGLRAMAKILLSYQLHGLSTVRQMIERWAPATENDTEAYVQDVASAMGLLPDDRVNLASDPVRMAAMVKAIVRHENGQQPYPDDLIDHALALAGVAAAVTA